MHLASKNYHIGYEFFIDEYIFREFTPLQNVGMYNMMDSMSAKIGFLQCSDLIFEHSYWNRLFCMYW